MEKIILNKNNNSIIKIITIESLVEEIDYFNPKSFDYFVKKGLNIKCKEDTTIAIEVKQYTKKSIKEMIKYHCFNNSKLDTKNDLPIFYPNIPDGFSLFCCKLEYLQLMEFIKKNKFGENKKYSDESDIFESDPSPNRKHYLCQICKTKFDNYKEHMISIIHCENKKKYKNSFQKIKSTFKRIVEFNKINQNQNQNSNDKINAIQLQYIFKENNKKISPINSEINNSLNNIGYVNIIHNENIDDNKDKSININSKLGKKKEITDLTKENKEKKDMRTKEIMNILNSIGSTRARNNMSFLKKRKRHEIEMDYFDLKKITGKIFFFNKLNEKNRKSNK